MIPIRATLPDLESILECLAGRNAIEANARHAVHLIRQQYSMPVYRSSLAQLVAYVDRNLVPLSPAESRRGNGAIDGQPHPHLACEINRQLFHDPD